MKDYKKKALVLTLASVMAVTGSFATENYKNCIMDMSFKPVSNNVINMVLSTKRLYEKNITPIKKDKNTYVIMLSEFDVTSGTPDLSDAGGLIESVDVKKMPYTNGNKGYTKITVKTGGNVNLFTTSTLYIPSDKKENLLETRASDEDIRREINENENKRVIKAKRQSVSLENTSLKNKYKTEAEPVKYSAEKEDSNESNENISIKQELQEKTNQENSLSVQTKADMQEKISNDNADFQKYMIGLFVLLIILTSIYFYKNAQNKLRNVMGEHFEIDIEDEQKEPTATKSSRKRQIHNTINKLDSIYAKTAVTSIANKNIIQNSNNNQSENDVNIVDLDELFNEQNKLINLNNDNNDENNEALDEFLREFSFEETVDTQNVTNELSKYDNSLYEQVINNNELTFNADDITCLNELLKSEISIEVINNPEKYLVTNPILPQKISKESILTNLITDYTINQNISFTTDDIDILRKLVNVEIDSDFITDLRTNSKRTKEVEREIRETTPKKSKPKEILTLKVSDMLPNLTEALKEQGDKPIECDVKHETVYCSEGYEVSKISTNIKLPDLTNEINNEKAYISKPSEKISVVDNTYADSVNKLTISGLPDLEDVMKNPEKYEDVPQEEFIPNEDELLNSIKNVQFKPFYDGTNKFEIINDNINDESVYETHDIEAIKNEFNQFDNFEVTDAEDDYNKQSMYTNDNDDFEALYNESEYFDLDAMENNTTNTSEPPKNIIDKIPKIIQKQNHKYKIQNKNAEDLLKQIESINNRKNSIQKIKEQKQTAMKEKKLFNKESEIKCIIDGVNYNIISSAKIQENIGCHLAHSGEKFVILAYNGNGDMKIIKEYDSIKGNKIQARYSENALDGASRYIIKIGLNKFIVELKNNELNYVMEL